jgi:hypothetical protein
MGRRHFCCRFPPSRARCSYLVSSVEVAAKFGGASFGAVAAGSGPSRRRGDMFFVPRPWAFALADRALGPRVD